MSTERLDHLLAMLADDPGDPFIRYAIALEHKRAGRMQQAAKDLTVLLKEDPTYLPCYYQLALLLTELGHMTDAISVCDQGAERCQAAGDRKARAELMELRNAISAEE